MSAWKGMKPDEPLPQPADNTTEFAHGRYGDDSGVVFSAAPEAGFCSDSLAVSDTFMDPIFKAMLDRYWRNREKSVAPLLALEWNCCTGWEAVPGPVELSREQAESFLKAAAELTSTDLAPHCQGRKADWTADCVRCAAVIQEFLASRLAKGTQVFIESE